MIVCNTLTHVCLLCVTGSGLAHGAIAEMVAGAQDQLTSALKSLCSLHAPEVSTCEVSTPVNTGVLGTPSRSHLHPPSAVLTTPQRPTPGRPPAVMTTPVKCDRSYDDSAEEVQLCGLGLVPIGEDWAEPGLGVSSAAEEDCSEAGGGDGVVPAGSMASVARIIRGHGGEDGVPYAVDYSSDAGGDAGNESDTHDSVESSKGSINDALAVKPVTCSTGNSVTASPAVSASMQHTSNSSFSTVMCRLDFLAQICLCCGPYLLVAAVLSMRGVHLPTWQALLLVFVDALVWTVAVAFGRSAVPTAYKSMPLLGSWLSLLGARLLALGLLLATWLGTSSNFGGRAHAEMA